MIISIQQNNISHGIEIIATAEKVKTDKNQSLMYRIWSCIGIKGEVSRDKKKSLSPPTPTLPPKHNSFSTDRSKAVPLLQLFFICASVVSYMAFDFVLICCSSLRLVVTPKRSQKKKTYIILTPLNLSFI